MADAALMQKVTTFGEAVVKANTRFERDLRAQLGLLLVRDAKVTRREELCGPHMNSAPERPDVLHLHIVTINYGSRKARVV